MTIRYQCDQCSSVLKIKDELAGRKGKCPKCKAAFIIPQPEPEPAAVSAPTAEKEPEDSSLSNMELTTTSERKITPPEPAATATPAADKPATTSPTKSESAQPKPKEETRSAEPPPVPEKQTAAQQPATKKVVPPSPETTEPAEDQPLPKPVPKKEVKEQVAPPKPVPPPVETVRPAQEKQLAAEPEKVAPAPEAAAPKADQQKAPAAPEAPTAAAEEDDDEFDPLSFLMDDDAPGAKASAGLTSPPPEEAPKKPMVDSMGRRMIAPSSTSGSNAGGSSSTASANPNDLLNKSMEDGPVKASPLPEKQKRIRINFSLPRGQLLRASGLLAGIIAVSLGLYWLSDRMMTERLPLPKLSPVAGTVTLDGSPLPNVNVHLTPISAQFLAADGKTPIRLSDSVGTTDANGQYEVMYKVGMKGAPANVKVKIWLSPVNPGDYGKIPAQYHAPNADTREVRVVGNGGAFDIQLKSR